MLTILLVSLFFLSTLFGPNYTTCFLSQFGTLIQAPNYKNSASIVLVKTILFGGWIQNGQVSASRGTARNWAYKYEPQLDSSLRTLYSQGTQPLYNPLVGYTTIPYTVALNTHTTLYVYPSGHTHTIYIYYIPFNLSSNIIKVNLYFACSRVAIRFK